MLTCLASNSVVLTSAMRSVIRDWSGRQPGPRHGGGAGAGVVVENSKLLTSTYTG